MSSTDPGALRLDLFQGELHRIERFRVHSLQVLLCGRRTGSGIFGLGFEKLL
jgi:hypothetical protein